MSGRRLVGRRSVAAALALMAVAGWAAPALARSSTPTTTVPPPTTVFPFCPAPQTCYDMRAEPLTVKVGEEYHVSGPQCPIGWTVTDISARAFPTGSISLDLTAVRLEQSPQGVEFWVVAGAIFNPAVPGEQAVIICHLGDQVVVGHSEFVLVDHGGPTSSTTSGVAADGGGSLPPSGGAPRPTVPIAVVLTGVGGVACLVARRRTRS